MRNIGWIAALCAAMALTAGCHNGGHAQNSTDMRAVNAISGAEPIDVLVDDDVKAAGIAYGAASSFAEFPDGTHDVKVRSSTTQTLFYDASQSFGSGTHSTLVAYGSRSSVSVIVLADDTTNPSSSGDFKLRVAGAAADAGPVDVYLTPSTDIGSTPATIASTAPGAVTNYVEGVAGTYVITVTVAGTKDVLLQSPAQGLAANTSYAFAVISSGGGKLVNAILLTQGSGTAVFITNPTGRVKAVNAVPDSSGFNFKANGATLLSNVPFGGASNYVTVASGTKTLQLEPSNVPGTIVATLQQQVDAARDYTMVAVNTLANAQIAVFTDDNSLPGTGLAKLRFANAQVDSPGTDVLLNFASQATGLPYKSASAYYSVPPSTTYTITFTTPGGVTVLATLSPAEIDAGGVYTAYLMGTASSPQVRLVRDR